MKSIITATFFAALLSPTASFAAGVWANEPATATALLDCPFNDASCGGKLWVWGGAGVTTQPAGAPMSAPNAVASHLAKNASTGGQGVTWPTAGNASPRSEIYVGLWWKMNADFQGYNSGSNKLFFVRNFEFTAGKDPTNGIFTLIGQPDKFPWQLVFGHNTGGLDNSHACSADMGLMCYPNVGSAPIYPDTWYQIEAYVKSSTCSTCRNGIVRWWVNGTMIGNYTNLNYGSGNMGEVTINHTWDGQPSASCYNPTTNPGGRDCSREWFHYFDHLHISAPNCGPSGCAAPAYLLITSSLSPARTGTPYTATLTADGGTKPYTWFLNSGSLPAGLTLSSGGVISGTPTCVGRSDFTIRVTDASTPALTATKSYSLITSGTGTTCTSGMEDRRESTVVSRELKTGMKIESRGGTVRFNLPAFGNAQCLLSVYNLSGKKVYEHKANNSGQKEIRIDAMLKNGIYFARLSYGQQSGSVKFNVMN